MLVINDISHRIAASCGCSPQEAEQFVVALFRLISATVEAEGSCEVPGLGRFAAVDGNVAFRPDDALASEVNAPFDGFEPIEIPAGVVFAEEETEPEETQEETQEEELPSLPQVGGPEEIEPPKPICEPEPIFEPESEPGPKPKKRSWFALVWIAYGVACMAVGFMLGRLSVTPMAPAAEIEKTILPDTAVCQTPDTSRVEETRISKPVVTDTISATRYLTTMAREHYRKMEYWVYIYEANADHLGHPDRLERGTVVVIPDADSLGLDPDDEQKVKEAIAVGRKIYSRFN